MALVEATGLEPVSKHILQKLSTCLFHFILSEVNWEWTTDLPLSWIVLSNRHSLWLQQPVLFLSRRRGVVTSQPARRPKWLLNHWLGSHGILCIAIWVFRIQIQLLITQRSTCLHFQRATLSIPSAPGGDSKGSCFSRIAESIVLGVLDQSGVSSRESGVNSHQSLQQ